MRKKVLYIITKKDIGGAPKYVSDLAENLDKNKFEAKILYGGKDIRWLSRDAKPWFLFLPDWLAIAELIKIYRKEKPDIVHLNSSKAGILGSLAAKIYKLSDSSAHQLKIVFTAHGWVFNPTNNLTGPVRWFYILLHKFAAFFQDKIICVSEYDYKLAIQYNIAPQKKLITIHNGIDLKLKFLDRETARKEIAKKLSAFGPQFSTRHWVGSIGRLVKEKNYETLIDAAAMAADIYFFVIGEGYEKKKYQSLIIKNNLQNRFFLINPKGNDAQYLKAFDIFVMSSIKEGLPYILLEAMAAELPIVVTEAGGIPEIIKNHKNGLMVSQKNPELLIKSIQGLIENKSIADELKTEAKNIVKEKFNLEKMVSQTEAVYNSF